MGSLMDNLNLPAGILVEMYVRIQDEVAGDERNLDPNHKLRTPIAVAILAAAKIAGPDIIGIEALVRQTISHAPQSEPIAVG